MSHTIETHKFVSKNKVQLRFIAHVYQRGRHIFDIFMCKVCNKIIKDFDIGTLALFHRDLYKTAKDDYNEIPIKYFKIFGER